MEIWSLVCNHASVPETPSLSLDEVLRFHFEGQGVLFQHSTLYLFVVTFNAELRKQVSLGSR